MANIKILLLICVVILGHSGLAQDKVDPQPPVTSPSPKPPTAPTTQSTTSMVPPKSSTTATTPKPTTNTTPKPTTTTTAPNTSTTVTTSTAKPSTTSAPTPAPTPTPVDPKVANWTVNYPNTTRACIVLFVAAQFVVPQTNLNRTAKINVPVNATASGSCEDQQKQTLVLTWGVNNSVEFDFAKTNTSKFDLDKVSATLNISAGTGFQVYNLTHNSAEFLTPLQNSYKCAKTQRLNLTDTTSNKTVAYLDVSHFQYQAFRNSTEHKFDSALDCEGSITPDVVPIVVGCVLAILVVAVLVAYLFGRRRCQARGYLSM